MRHAGHWKGSMVSKYVVEIETETGHAAFCTAQIAAAFSNNSELTLHLVSSPSVVVRYRNAEAAGAAYRKIADAIRSVA